MLLCIYCICTILFLFYIHICYSIICGHFGFCGRTQLTLRDAAFEMHLSFHVWDFGIHKSSIILLATLKLFLLNLLMYNKLYKSFDHTKCFLFPCLFIFHQKNFLNINKEVRICFVFMFLFTLSLPVTTKTQKKHCNLESVQF